jgi:choline-sulfatase
VTRRPDVVLLTVDCLRHDRCGFCGHHRDTTPTLDGLAREATVFDAAVAPGPRTSESVPGIVAGALSADCAYLGEHAHKAVPSDGPTLATWLGGEDYRTVAALSNPQLTPDRRFDRGFDSFANLRTGERGGDDPPATERDVSGARGLLARARGRLRDPVRDRLRERGPGPRTPATLALLAGRAVRRRVGWPTVSGERVVTELLSALDAGPDDRPTFAWAHLNDLHAPLHPGRVRDGGLLGNVSDLRQFRWDARRVANVFEPGYAAMYDSALRYVDTQIARVVDRLRATDRWDRTVLVVTADHGEALHDRGVYGHAAGTDRYAHDPTRDYMYEELLHVPLLVRTPDDRRGRVDDPFSLVWLHELLADVLGIDRGPFPRSSGRADHRAPATDAVVLADAVGADGHTVVARAGSDKRISPCLGGDRGRGADPLLFDLALDPGERTDLSDERTVPALADATESVFTRPDELGSVRAALDAATRERLDQLGYR